MKKLLAFLLVLSMIITSTVLFSSCSRVSEKDLEKDATATLTDSVSTAFTEFFDMNEDLYRAAADAIKGGAVSISLSGGEMLFGGALGKIEQTFYFDEDDKKMVSDTEVTYGDEKYSLRLFGDEEGFAASSEDLFGSKTAYMIKLDGLVSQLEDSSLLEYLGITGRGLDDLLTIAEAVEDAVKDTKEDDEIEEIFNEALAALDPETDTEDIETEEGEVTCRTVTYTLNKSTIKDAAEIIIKGMMPKGDQRDAMLDSLDEMFSEDETLSYKLKVAVAKKGGRLVQIALDGKEGYSYSGEYSFSNENKTNASVTFSESEIYAEVKRASKYTSGDGEVSEHDGKMTAKITKEEDGDKVKYKLTVKEDGETQLTGSLTYSKDSGKFKLSAGDDGEFVLEGKITGDESKATLAVSSVTVEEATIELDIEITFDADADIPSTPSNTKNILTMDEDDVEEFVADLRESKLFALFGGIF